MGTFKKAKEELDRILTLFESGKIVDAVAISTLPPLDVPSASWSLQNRVLQFLAGTSDARGFRQWNEVGRKVKKGSRAFYILGPVIKKVKTEDEETGEEKEEEKLVGFKTIPVFRSEDTERKPLPTLEPPQPPPLIEVAKRWDVSVSYHSFAGNVYGYFSPGSNDIVLATHDESTPLYKGVNFFPRISPCSA